jgi:uncharacterized UPF0160 family protein
MVQRNRRSWRRQHALAISRLLGLRLAVVTTAYCSQTARYNRLIEDVRNDVMRVDPFFRSARYVVDMDRKREKSLAYVTILTVEERDNTLQRIVENRNIVRWV